MRALVLASAFLLPPAAAAADLPKPLTEDQRAGIAKRWRADFDKRLAAEQGPYAREMQKAPTRTRGAVFSDIGLKARAGQVGHLMTEGLEVTGVGPDGVVLEGEASPLEAKDGVVRYLFPVPPAGADKLGAKVKLTGLYHVAGTVERGGRTLAVLYPFELKKNELPPPPKK